MKFDLRHVSKLEVLRYKKNKSGAKTDLKINNKMFIYVHFMRKIIVFEHRRKEVQ